MALLLAGAWSCAWANDVPISVNSEPEKINYSVGYEFGGYLSELERRGTGVDLSAVFKGVLDALSGAEPVMSRTEMQAARAGLTRHLAAAKAATAAKPSRTRIRSRERGFNDDYAALNAKREGVISLASGVQYEVLQSGTGRHPGDKDEVTVSYEGTLSNGVVFDSTYEQGEPIELSMDQIAVPGLKEALLLMKEGDQWRVVIPPAMGFGRSGNNMLRKRDLIYEIELVSVESPQQ